MFRINSILSSNSAASAEDVLKIKNALRSRGYYDVPEYGLTPYTDRTLFDGIRRYQKDKGLKIDGIIKPDGETIESLKKDQKTLGISMQKRPADGTGFWDQPILTQEEQFGINRWGERIEKPTGVGKIMPSPEEDADPLFGKDIFGDDFGSGADEDGDGFETVSPSEANEESEDSPESDAEVEPGQEQETQVEPESEEGEEESPKPEEQSPAEEPVFDATGRMIRDGESNSKYFDIIENTYREHVKTSRNLGLEETADNLEHFLDGSGDDKILDPEKVREKEFVKAGEKENKNRFEESFVDRGKFGERLLNLKDGETIKLNDNWDYKVGALPIKEVIENRDLSRSHLLSGNLDDYLSTGTSFVKSDGKFEAKKEGRIVTIKGVVEHNWSDLYDFNAAGSGGAGSSTLEHKGRAKSFNIKSGWKQDFFGTLNVNSGQLSNPQFKWGDIEHMK